jgi:hypothetical protein
VCCRGEQNEPIHFSRGREKRETSTHLGKQHERVTKKKKENKNRKRRHEPAIRRNADVHWENCSAERFSIVFLLKVTLK